MSSKKVRSHARGKAGGDFQTGGVIAISACHFIHDVYSSFLAPLLPLLIEKFGMSLTRAGLLSTVMQIPALLNPYLGSLADRVSARYFIIFAPMGTAVPMCLLGLAPSYGVLLILLFITGVSVAVFHVPAPTMIARLSGGSKGKGMSFYMTGGELARTVGPLAAVGGVSVLGLEGFYPVMVVGVLASGWLFFRFRDVPVQMKKGQAREPILRTWRRTRYVLGPLIGILVARGFMHACMTAYLPTFIKQETGDLWL
ncbi:MAG: MFS transporter, partial [Desulfobacterales bacterium]|nr:MFS transporter [Desulfobacterales bacterium]